jgi:predicted MFS family arabinose efflux permease
MKTGKPSYGGYVLALLLTGYALNSFDRSILNLLLEPIRLELGASDTQLGLLSGLAFGLVYSTLAIPIAALADRWNRRNVLVLSVLLWTSMTALCGLAGSFAALLLARVGVAVGQAGGSPASHSLLADYFPANRRATALGIYTLGAPAGAMLAGLFGGWGSEHLGWRATLLLAGAPGLLLVPLLFLTVAEPRHSHPAALPAAAAPSMATVLRHLWSRPSFRHLCIACALHSVAMYSASSFNPAYLARSHDWDGVQIGQLVAMTGLAGLTGTFLGGLAADRLGVRHGDPRWHMWIPGVATFAVIPVQIVCYLGSGLPMVAAFLLSSLLSLVFFGPSYATVQALAAPRMRAVAASLLLFSKAIVGMGAGPLLVGAMSDRLAPLADERALGFSLLLVPMFNLWAAFHFFIGARHLRADLKRT